MKSIENCDSLRQCNRSGNTLLLEDQAELGGGNEGRTWTALIDSTERIQPLVLEARNIPIHPNPLVLMRLGPKVAYINPMLWKPRKRVERYGSSSALLPLITPQGMLNAQITEAPRVQSRFFNIIPEG